MKQATFLWKNERGIYFFRARVPKQFSEHFNCSEIKKSLQTDSYRLAVKLARAYRVELDKEMERLKKGSVSAFSVTLEGKVAAKLPNGSERLVEGKITRDIASPDETTEHKGYLLNQLREEADRLEKQAQQQALFEAQLKAVQSTQAQQPTQQQTEQSPLYSEIAQHYLDDGAATNRWTPKSFAQVKSSLELFQDFVGDLPITTIDKAITRGFKAQYLKLPSNRNKKAEYRDKSIGELLGMDIPKDDLIDTGTVSSNMTRIGGFFAWAKNHDYIQSNPFESIIPKKDKRKASRQRDAFSKDELTAIFESNEYQHGFKRGSDHWKYWIPIIGLYTGMRLEEICRIRVDWFDNIHDIPTIEIKPDGEWYGKTDAALRSFAVHPRLIDLGLLKLVETQREADKQRLFNELGMGRDGYGGRVSKWFGRYLERLGITDEKKVFHSLRHTFLNELKQNGVTLEVREAIAGHENDSQSESRYGKAYIAEVTLGAMQKADFNLNHPLLKVGSW